MMDLAFRNKSIIHLFDKIITLTETVELMKWIITTKGFNDGDEMTECSLSSAGVVYLPTKCPVSFDASKISMEPAEETTDVKRRG